MSNSQQLSQQQRARTTRTYAADISRPRKVLILTAIGEEEIEPVEAVFFTMRRNGAVCACCEGAIFKGSEYVYHRAMYCMGCADYH